MSGIRKLPPGDNESYAVVNAASGVAAPAPVGNPVYAEHAADADEEDLFQWWIILRRRKRELMLAAFLGTVAGLLWSLPQTPIYRAKSTIEVKSLNENYLDLGDVSPTRTAITGYSSNKMDIATQVEIMTSNSVIERVVDKIEFEKYLETEGEPGRVAAWRKLLFGAPEPKAQSLRARAVALAKTNLDVEPKSRTRIVDIYFHWPEPTVAAEFTNALTDTFIEQSIEARWETAHRTGDWLTGQLEQLRIKLERSDEELQNYARVSGLMFTSQQGSVAEEKLRQLQQELSRAQAERIEKQSRFELRTKSSADALPEILDHGPLRDYQVRLTDLRREMADLSVTHKPTHYKVKRVQSQIAELEKAVRTERSHVVDRVKNEYQAAARRETLLGEQYETQARLVTVQAGKSIPYNILKREVDTNRQLYESLLQKVKEATVAAAMSATNIRVVDPARTPLEPYSPNHAMNASLGLFAGLVLGAVVVMARERMDRRLKDPKDVSDFLPARQLGVIPSFNGKREALTSGSKAKVKVRRNGDGNQYTLSLRGIPKAGRDNCNVELVSWLQKPSLMAEYFRAALMSILFTAENSDQLKTLLVTSPDPEEGKTTVVCNLAIALTEVKQRVLLIDADMRKPRLHKIFGLPNRRGLADVLSNGTAGENDSFAPVQETDVPGLYLLSSGPRTPSILHCLHSPRTAELLRQARENFDIVVIDTPPMMQIADARILGQMVDGIILVVRADKTTRDTARAAIDRFSEDGSRVLGTILNDWNPETSGYGYYSDYYDDRYYSGEREEGEA